MNLISIIIPFYQNEPNILSKALISILAQKVPEGWSAEIIIVDDGSPSPAEAELEKLSIIHPFYYKLIKQKNSGVSAARNAGLENASCNADLIAFLDSDDEWPDNHILRAVEARSKGFNFYFCDSYREGHQNSSLNSKWRPRTKELLFSTSEKTDFFDIPKEKLITLNVMEFITRLVTIVFNAEKGRNIRFNTDLKYAGEDILYALNLLLIMDKFYFDPNQYIRRGSGISMYESNQAWDAPKFYGIMIDQLIVNSIYRDILPYKNIKEVHNERMSDIRLRVAFHTFRNIFRDPKKLINHLCFLYKIRKSEFFILPFFIPYAIWAYIFNRNLLGLKDS